MNTHTLTTQTHAHTRARTYVGDDVAGGVEGGHVVGRGGVLELYAEEGAGEDVHAGGPSPRADESIYQASPVG
jgi:hypothetical protein